MSDAVILGVISLGGSVVTTIGIVIVAYVQYGQKKVGARTERKVDEVHELTNSRLARIELALAAMTRERDALLDRETRPPEDTA